MLEILSINHVGIRISDKQASIDFYSGLGFEMLNDVGLK